MDTEGDVEAWGRALVREGEAKGQRSKAEVGLYVAAFGANR